MWRYKLVPMGPLAREETRLEFWEGKLSELGGEGWEAVAVVGQGDWWCVLLKMPHDVGTY
jgi:hypothetical protein